MLNMSDLISNEERISRMQDFEKMLQRSDPTEKGEFEEAITNNKIV